MANVSHRRSSFVFVKTPSYFLSSDKYPYCFQQRSQVRRPDDVDAARERVGCKRQADERRVAAVAAAHDRDRVAPRHVVADGEFDRVEQIVLHRAAPFAVAREHVPLAEADATAKIDLQTSITLRVVTRHQTWSTA